MKELILFSLKRRFLNSTTFILNLLLCFFIACICFADEVIEFINPTMLEQQKIFINLDENIEDAFVSLETNGIEFILDERQPKDILHEYPQSYVLTFDNGYKITSQYEMNKDVLLAIEGMINNVHQMLFFHEVLTIEEQVVMNHIYEVENIVLEENMQMDTNKQNIIFMLITSIYFTMLSFSTTVANEVIYEKSTKQLELILTSVSAKTHFLSKMIVGWLTIVIQMCSVGIYGILFLFVRNFYDSGKGLIQLINQLNLIEIKEETFMDLLNNLSFDFDFIMKICFIFFFLMMGVLLLQMIMVILSSFIVSVEEAGNVQGPFYMILLGIYYFALSLNTPYQMSEGFGYILSFFPFLNMLFMPCRLLIQNVSAFELLLSALVSILFMIIVLVHGVKVYQRGVLDYTNKGFMDVLKKTFVNIE